MLILDSDAVLARGLRSLTRRDPVIKRMVAEGARPPLRKREPGFEGLARIIVSQQLSTASAGAIWARLTGRFPEISPADITSASDEDLRAAGLSAPKMRTLRAIAAAIASGALPIDRLGDMGADEAHAVLTTVKGIGPWTADIYLLFCLGHPDAFPAGDLALQEAARLAYDLAARPKEQEFVALAERWRPWRGVAAKVLWAYYRVAKSREGAPVTSP
ncbi:MAG TPA: DNA-3-methyladenine glycosylase 2 family protein [Beijerinckiaceae bacterium]|nr:DNA-3-methyladenine glycosylase 2 family protein [Beijerinckiaceae bacterium]